MPIQSVRPGEVLTQIRQLRLRAPYNEEDIAMDDTMEPEK